QDLLIPLEPVHDPKTLIEVDQHRHATASLPDVLEIGRQLHQLREEAGRVDMGEHVDLAHVVVIAWPPHYNAPMGTRFLQLLAALALTVPGQAPADRPQAIFDRAVADFRNGRITESVAAFDALAQL